MSIYISQELADRFRRFGEKTYIQRGGEFSAPERMALGSGIFMRAPYRLSAASEEAGDGPAVAIGDGCQINMGLRLEARRRIELGAAVLLGSHVYLSDRAELRTHPASGLPLPARAGRAEAEGATNGLYIGEGAWIGPNAVVLGPLRIGRGSVVQPGSVVYDDVPDYCVAGGSPARITAVYEASSGAWTDVSDEDEAKALLAARRAQPLLSICIPTYNRAPYLEHCLQTIFSQIADHPAAEHPLIEVVVSDNASTDATPEVLARFGALYPNLRYTRNASNIGADPNIFEVMRRGKGVFVKLQGDDDFYVPGTLMPLLNALHRHRDCGVVHVNVRNGDGQMTRGEGMSDYLRATSIYATFITSTIFRRADLEQVAEPALFLASSFNQLYLQYAVLAINPRYCLMNNSMFTYAGLSSDAYNFGEVVFRSYQSIIRHFVGKGLTEADLAFEKHQTLYGYAIPWLRRIVGSGMVADTSRFEEIYTEHYRDEPYYAYGMAAIAAIRAGSS